MNGVNHGMGLVKGTNHAKVGTIISVNRPGSGLFVSIIIQYIIYPCWALSTIILHYHSWLFITLFAIENGHRVIVDLPSLDVAMPPVCYGKTFTTLLWETGKLREAMWDNVKRDVMAIKVENYRFTRGYYVFFMIYYSPIHLLSHALPIIVIYSYIIIQ